ncbi:MAG: GNAT family N-acetyltransferase [Nocardioides sp.]
MNAHDALAAYDRDLRTSAEVHDALRVDHLGPLWIATYDEGRGFITYRDLDGADGAQVADLVASALAHVQAIPELIEVEWKTRSHDHAPGLVEALVAAGFTAEDEESVMVGEAAALGVEVPLPDGVTLRQVRDEADLRRMVAMQDAVFGSPTSATELIRRLAEDPTIECWVAEADGEIVTAGRLHPVPGTEFAGIWGGATRPEWRGRGIYRALTAARARSALKIGKSFIHSDSTDYSRPILERYGFTRVTGSVPYRWRRG